MNSMHVYTLSESGSLSVGVSSGAGPSPSPSSSDPSSPWLGGPDSQCVRAFFSPAHHHGDRTSGGKTHHSRPVYVCILGISSTRYRLASACITCSFLPSSLSPFLPLSLPPVRLSLYVCGVLAVCAGRERNSHALFTAATYTREHSRRRWCSRCSRFSRLPLPSVLEAAQVVCVCVCVCVCVRVRVCVCVCESRD